MSSPKADPIGTVRIHPDDDPMEITSRRNIKVMSTSYGPYDGEGWMELTFANGHAAGGGNTLINHEQPPEWPVQPWWQLAAVLGLPSGQEEPQRLVERRAEVREEWRNTVAGDLLHFGCTCSPSLEPSLVGKITEAVLLLERERDQAIAHDRQPYPTAWSYEKLSEAYEGLFEGLKHQLELLVGKEVLDQSPGYPGLLKVLGEALTQAKLARQMGEMLAEHGYPSGPQGLANFFSDVQRVQSEMLDRDEQIKKGKPGEWSVIVPTEFEAFMRDHIAGWLESERADIIPLTPAQIADGAAGAAFAALEAADLLLAPELRSGPLVKVALGLPPGMYISDVYARFRAAGFALRLDAGWAD